MTQFFAICLYFSFLFAYTAFRRKRSLSQKDFVIGGRSMNWWTTAMAAQASDMSNWLFMAYPGAIFAKGGAHMFAAIGLILMMWVNWRLIAPRIRKETEKTQSVTITGFFEKKLGAEWPMGRLVTSVVLFVFYTIYVSVMLSGMGLLVTTLFPISYGSGVLIGIGLILPYLMVGGYLTLAKVDLFQGVFLLLVIVFVPVFALGDLGGFAKMAHIVQERGKSLSLFSGNLWSGIFLMFGWGLGYFGQPHILTKFMGIKNPKEMHFSRRFGMSWQMITLSAATLVGFVGLAVFDKIGDPEQVFIELVKHYFPPFIAGLFLCGIIATIINAASSMLLVLSTTVSEDIYKRFVNKVAKEKQLLKISRLATLVSALIAMAISLGKFASLDQLVLYAWSGLGASFGPLVIAALYFDRLTSKGAWLGMVTGGSIVAIWPLFGLEMESLVVAFPVALGVIYWSSRERVVVKEW